MTNSARDSSYLAFCDESGLTGKERFQAISTVSGSRGEMRILHNQLRDLLKKYGRSDIKFTKVGGHSTSTQVSKEFIALGLRKCYEKTIRINVMVWDTQDSRHSVRRRDDIENFKRMYYHALKTSIKQWPAQLTWEFYPDEHTAIKWHDITSYLSKTNLAKSDSNELYLSEKFREFNFVKIHTPNEATSSKFFIIQLADIFAGMVRTSHSCGYDFIEWRQVNSSNGLLFTTDKNSEISTNQNAKFEIMSYFKDMADSYHLGVNLSKDKYFQTFCHNNNIFLWKYEPQHENDKAPIKLKI
jgi:Protein of unknown function (DUF3800)